MGRSGSASLGGPKSRLKPSRLEKYDSMSTFCTEQPHQAHNYLGRVPCRCSVLASRLDCALLRIGLDGRLEAGAWWRVPLYQNSQAFDAPAR